MVPGYYTRIIDKKLTLFYQNIARSLPSSQVTGSTLGIVGFGNIGRALSERAKGFKMNILYHCRARKEELEKSSGNK